MLAIIVRSVNTSLRLVVKLLNDDGNAFVEGCEIKMGGLFR